MESTNSTKRFGIHVNGNELYDELYTLKLTSDNVLNNREIASSEK